MKLRLHNTLTKKKEEFKPLKEGSVKMYACGPTVYNYAHIGNLRTYIFEDILKRALFYNGFKVKHVMNVTDVGHLTGDRDMGEDKIETGAKREGKSAWEIAEYYTRTFKDDIKKLNILEPDILCKATDHIKEQIKMISALEKKGYAYKISDGMYFDTQKFSAYTKLSHKNLASLKEGARVEKNPEKRNATDFALWKFTPFGVKRQMEWDSPWGKGFPGWHIECSAMSVKYLGEQFDIHCGGIDHIDVHHTNELAQTEAATGKSPWVRFWLHGAFLNVSGGKKMAKSGGNFLTLENAVIKKGFNPLAYRFATLNTHYRKPMEYSEIAMVNAQNGLNHLYNQLRELRRKMRYNQSAGKAGRRRATAENASQEFKEKFLSAMNDDLNMPKALAVAQDLLKSKLPDKEKLAAILDFDRVFGLSFKEAIGKEEATPEEVKKLADEREAAREKKDWKKSDELRDKIKTLGYTVEDSGEGARIKKINTK
ncbi:MAG: cysteine--tRNA ligase [Patescibacteria group bacterium]|jgi:cysteinyl-tRNA synthetase